MPGWDDQQWYRLNDGPVRSGAIEIKPSEALAWNANGWGIFWAVQEFDGPRKIERLKKIRAWAVDMDQGTKDQQLARIASAPLVPSLVIETSRGFHVYYFAKSATEATFRPIVCDRLVPFFRADGNAKDLARILRVPGFHHRKGEPFLVRVVFDHAVSYTEHSMLNAFGVPDHVAAAQEAHAVIAQEHAAIIPRGDDFFTKLFNVDSLAALPRLSGHAAVHGERFSFLENRNGTHQILVNGKTTSCWVDVGGRIGSHSHGGPTLWQWLAWYGTPGPDIYKIICDVLPELKGTGR